MATNNVVNSPLSGQTGTANFVGSNSPVLTTPTLGVATATSIQFSPTTNEFVGTTTANNANTGIVGEFISSIIPVSSAISIPANATPTDLTNISLTAGDWNVWGNLYFIINSGTINNVDGWVSSTSATAPAAVFAAQTACGFGTNVGLEVPMLRFSLSGTTTVYITGLLATGTATITFCGGIYARRVR